MLVAGNFDDSVCVAFARTTLAPPVRPYTYVIRLAHVRTQTHVHACSLQLVRHRPTATLAQGPLTGFFLRLSRHLLHSLSHVTREHDSLCSPPAPSHTHASEPAFPPPLPAPTQTHRRPGKHVRAARPDHIHSPPPRVSHCPTPCTCARLCCTMLVSKPDSLKRAPTACPLPRRRRCLLRGCSRCYAIPGTQSDGAWLPATPVGCQHVPQVNESHM